MRRIAWPQWTGFGNKTLWEWLELLGALAIPIMVALVGVYFTLQQSKTQNKIEQQRAQAAALQAYLDQMGSLLLKNGLRNSEEDSEERTLARARTLTVLDGLDPDRKGRLLQFLNEANLINPKDPVLDLSGADATDADLSNDYLGVANLRGANLSGANLSGAKLWGIDLSCAPPVETTRTSSLSCTDLSGANLSSADLSGANLSCAEASIWWNEGQMDRTRCVDLSGANLSGAKLWGTDLSGAILTDVQGFSPMRAPAYLLPDLEGATMPNGQQMPLGLPEKGRSPHPVDIEAGVYTTDEFRPAFAFKVDKGWAVLRSETLDELSMEKVGGSIGGELILTNPQSVYAQAEQLKQSEKGCVPPNPFEVRRDRNPIMLPRCPAPKNVDEWISWFQNHPKLETSKPVPVSVGSVSGKRIDVKVTSEPKNVCGRFEIPCVPLFTGSPPGPSLGGHDIGSELSHLEIIQNPFDDPTGSPSPGVFDSYSKDYDLAKDRFVIVDVEGETVVIKITATFWHELDEFFQTAQKILDTVEWKPRGQEYVDWLKSKGSGEDSQNE